MDFSLIAYILLTVIVGGFAISTLYKRGQTIGAFLSLVLLILVFTFYGLRWFEGGEVKGKPNPNASWPPIVNMCPDFMATWTAPDNKVYCYDATNMYGLKQAGEGSGLTGNLTINGRSGQSAYLIKDPNQNPKAANLREDTQGKRWPLLAKLSSSPQDITNDTRGGQLVRWEGVMDGRQVNPQSAPLP